MNQTIEELAHEAGLTGSQVERVLRALRRPKPRMVNAGQDMMLACSPQCEDPEARIWTAMVDAALD